ncbi:MAG: hypothetical protein WBQ44_21090 [Rhodococcus sp. (in: high G+C Gram-positive bacteria)]
MSTGKRAILRRIVAVVVAACALFTLVNGIVEGSWLSILFAVASAVVLVDWLRPKPLRQPLDPATVPPDDVRASIASTDSRIMAIKSLREKHDGLGLKDAKDLVDAQLDT